MTDWQAVRAEFPALANWTHLNTATFGQLARRTTAAVAAHFARRDEQACWDFLSWFDDMDRIRGVVGQFVNCRAEDIAFLTNACTALSLLIAGLKWEQGDRVVTLAHEFPNNLYAPAAVESNGVEFVAPEWEHFYEAIDERTRLVAISTANYNTGFVPPLEEIAEFLRRRGVLLYVDGTQSVGALRFDVGRVKPDILAVHGYKWLLSPVGAGFMYVSPELRERLAPAVIGWRSHRDWRNVDNLHHGTPEFSPSAEKYEGGMIPFELIYAMEASIAMMLEIGLEVIEKRVLALADEVRGIVRRAGGEPVSVNSAIVSAKFPGRDPSELARALKDRRILVAARRGMLRISPHFYNDEGDLERLERALQIQK